MTDNQIKVIKQVLMDVELLEIGELELLSNVNFTPSDAFNKKIARIINFEKNRENSILKLTFRKRIAVLIAAIITALTVFSACAFGNQIKDFFIEVYESTTRLFSNSENEYEYIEYTFTYIPEGYKPSNIIRYENTLISKYANEENTLTITQCKLSGSSIQINTEGKGYQTINVGNYKVYYVNNKSMNIAVWSYEGNSFDIVCHESLSWDEIEKIILGAKTNTN